MFKHFTVLGVKGKNNDSIYWVEVVDGTHVNTAYIVQTYDSHRSKLVVHASACISVACMSADACVLNRLLS